MTKKTIKVIKLNDALLNNYKSKKNTSKTIHETIVNTNPETLKEIIKKKYKTKHNDNKKVRFDVPKKIYKSPRASKKKQSVVNKPLTFKLTKPITKGNLIPMFQEIIKTNNIILTNQFIKKINKRQTILILYSVSIVKKNTKAPTPLLKNILYNYLTSSIKIIV
jgi:hypothetical protein